VRRTHAPLSDRDSCMQLFLASIQATTPCKQSRSHIKPLISSTLWDTDCSPPLGKLLGGALCGFSLDFGQEMNRGLRGSHGSTALHEPAVASGILPDVEARFQPPGKDARLHGSQDGRRYGSWPQLAFILWRSSLSMNHWLGFHLDADRWSRHTQRARAHGMWTYKPRQGRKAAAVVRSASAVVPLATI